VGPVADFAVYDGQVFLLRRDGQIWLSPNGNTRQLAYCPSCLTLPLLIVNHNQKSGHVIYNHIAEILFPLVTLLLAILGLYFRKKLLGVYRQYRIVEDTPPLRVPPSRVPLSQVDVE
jgi:hypothetical protein